MLVVSNIASQLWLTQRCDPHDVKAVSMLF